MNGARRPHDPRRRSWSGKPSGTDAIRRGFSTTCPSSIAPTQTSRRPGGIASNSSPSISPTARRTADTCSPSFSTGRPGLGRMAPSPAPRVSSSPRPAGCGRRGSPATTPGTGSTPPAPNRATIPPGSPTRCGASISSIPPASISAPPAIPLQRLRPSSLATSFPASKRTRRPGTTATSSPPPGCTGRWGTTTGWSSTSVAGRQPTSSVVRRAIGRALSPTSGPISRRLREWRICSGSPPRPPPTGPPRKRCGKRWKRACGTSGAASSLPPSATAKPLTALPSKPEAGSTIQAASPAAPTAAS